MGAESPFARPMAYYGLVSRTMKTKQQLDRYTVLRKLATGGMGEVFVARQVGLAGFEKLVVLKTLKPELADQQQFRHMFLEEARVAALTRHSNVVSVLDVGMEDDTYFIVMEYIEGWSVRQVLEACARRGAPLPLRFVLPIAIDMATGLAYVHDLHDSAGRALALVHRDVSPENVMITLDGQSKLVDFGIAKRQDSPIETAPGVLKGKARYLSPEQVRGGRVTPATDQFALASVLFEMAAGAPLFPGKNTAAVVFAMGSGDIPDPGQMCPELPAGFAAILRRALAKDPANRFPSCAQLAKELAQIQETSGARASRAELTEFLRQRVPHNRSREATSTGTVAKPQDSTGTGTGSIATATTDVNSDVNRRHQHRRQLRHQQPTSTHDCIADVNK